MEKAALKAAFLINLLSICYKLKKSVCSNLVT